MILRRKEGLVLHHDGCLVEIGNAVNADSSQSSSQIITYLAVYLTDGLNKYWLHELTYSDTLNALLLSYISLRLTFALQVRRAWKNDRFRLSLV